MPFRYWSGDAFSSVVCSHAFLSSEFVRRWDYFLGSFSLFLSVVLEASVKCDVTLDPALEEAGSWLCKNNTRLIDIILPLTARLFLRVDNLVFLICD